MSTRTLGAFVALAAIAFSACSVTGGGSSGGSGGTITGDWQLSSYASNGTLTDVPAGVTVTAVFAAGRINGTSGCNQYFGSYTTDGAKITISETGGTMMACPGPVMAVEQAYLANLGKAATFTATSTDLTMYASDDTTILKYASTPVVPITTGTFHVTALNNGSGGVVSVAAGVDLTATFGTDGTVSGFSGCNTFNGPYTLSGDAIKIGPIATTKMACAADAMTTEAQYLAALASSTTVELAPTTLGLRDASGATQVQFVRRSS
jgi:heat shock protein HslJ